MTPSSVHCDGLIFDLDGTLIDSAPDIAAGINEYFSTQGWPTLQPGFVAGFTGKGTRRLIEDILLELGLPSDDETVSRAVDGYLSAYRRAPSRHTRFYRGVKEDLQVLHDAGFLLGVCTNKQHDLALRILEILGIRGLFSAVAGADDVPASKPDPAHLHAVARRMGLSSQRCVYVGDTGIDQQTAVAAGVAFYAVPWGTGGQLVVDSGHRLSRLSDLLHLRSAPTSRQAEVHP